MARDHSARRSSIAAPVVLLGLLLAACEGSVSRATAGSADAPARHVPATGPSRSSAEPRIAPTSDPAAVAPAPAPVSRPPADPGRADTDPANDEVVAPPEPITDCEARLSAAGVRHRPATLPLRQPRRGTYTCGAPQVVVYERGPTDLRWSSPPVVTCGMALALARFELLLQSRAEATLGSKVARVRQGGTYSCRKMTRFTGMVSEHSYANAIDIYSFVLTDGREVSIKTHFGKLGQDPASPLGKFLRELARSAYDDEVFSVVLTPFFDRLHADHLHLDLARYRVDGTR